MQPDLSSFDPIIAEGDQAATRSVAAGVPTPRRAQAALAEVQGR